MMNVSNEIEQMFDDYEKRQGFKMSENGRAMCLAWASLCNLAYTDGYRTGFNDCKSGLDATPGVWYGLTND